MIRLTFHTNHDEPSEFARNLSIITGRDVHITREQSGDSLMWLELPSWVIPSEYINALNDTIDNYHFELEFVRAT